METDSKMLYLDWAAAALPDPEVREFARTMPVEYFANQESGHALGFRLRQKLAEAESSLSRTFWGREGGRAVWGSCCTELFQLLAASPLVRGRRVASSVLEHPALSAALKREAKELALLRCDRNGQLVPEPGECFALAAFHAVQSELGAVQELSHLFSAYPGVVRFVDAAQAAGKLKLPDCDLAAISGAKLGVPGGGAALLLHPDWKGAAEFSSFAAAYRKQQHRLSRVPAAVIMLLAFAAELKERRREETYRAMAGADRELRILAEKCGLVPTLPARFASPFILHLTAPGRQGAVLVRMLSERGVMASSGSACAAESPDPSPALVALGYRRRDAYSGLRLSFGGALPAAARDFLSEELAAVLKNY